MIEKRQNLLIASLDILVLELTIGMDAKFIYVVNLYNAPVGYRKVGQVISTMLGADTLIQQYKL